MSDLKGLLTGRTAPQVVPPWFYKEDGLCGITKASFIWWFNTGCCFFHTLLAITSVIAATRDGKGMDTPKLAVYLTNLTWTPNTTSMLVPSYQEVEGLYLAHMTLWFFLLSALAHGIIAVGNYRQAFAVSDPEAQRITRWTGWYYVWIHQCRQPLRYVAQRLEPALLGACPALLGC